MDGKERNTSTEHEQQVERLVKELREAKDTVRSLNSENSELRSQLEVLASRTPDSSGTPNGMSNSSNLGPEEIGDRQTPTEGGATAEKQGIHSQNDPMPEVSTADANPHVGTNGHEPLLYHDCAASAGSRKCYSCYYGSINMYYLKSSH